MKKKKDKILECTYDKDTHLTYIKKQTPYGIFEAYTKPIEEDLDVANIWSGGVLAELKCDLKSLKREAYIKSQRVIGARNVLRTVIHNNIDNMTPEWWDFVVKLEREIDAQDRQIQDMRAIAQSYPKFAAEEVARKREIRKRWETKNDTDVK